MVEGGGCYNPPRMATSATPLAVLSQRTAIHYSTLIIQQLKITPTITDGCLAWIVIIPPLWGIAALWTRLAQLRLLNGEVGNSTGILVLMYTDSQGLDGSTKHVDLDDTRQSILLYGILITDALHL